MAKFRYVRPDEIDLEPLTAAQTPMAAGRRLRPVRDDEIDLEPFGGEPAAISKWQTAKSAAAQAATFGFADELTAAARSAMGSLGVAPDVTYRQAVKEERDWVRRAEEANPWTSRLVGIGTGIAMGGGLGGLAAKAGLTGLRAAAAGGALEGAVSGVGQSEGETVGQIVKDAATSAALGGVLGGAVHYGVGKYIKRAPERHAKNIAEDITEGTNFTNKKRFAQVQAIAPEVFDSDKALLRLAKREPAEARNEITRKLNELSQELKPAYATLDKKVPFDTTAGWMEMAEELDRIKYKGAETEWRAALSRAMKDYEETLAANPAGASWRDARAWVTGLLKNADSSLGSLAETERYILKDQLWEVGDRVLKGQLKAAKAAGPEAKAAVEAIEAVNPKIAVLAKTDDALAPRAMKEAVGHQGLMQKLKAAGLPVAVGGAAGLSGGALPAIAGGLAMWGTQRAGRAANRATTAALARLVRAASRGDATAELARDAIQTGVPLGVVNAIMARSRPDESPTFDEAP